MSQLPTHNHAASSVLSGGFKVNEIAGSGNMYYGKNPKESITRPTTNYRVSRKHGREVVRSFDFGSEIRMTMTDEDQHGFGMNRYNNVLSATDSSPTNTN